MDMLFFFLSLFLYVYVGFSYLDLSLKRLLLFRLLTFFRSYFSFQICEERKTPRPRFSLVVSSYSQTLNSLFPSLFFSPGINDKSLGA